MRKFLLYSSALAVLGLSGMAEAACIQTPTCSSLGYTSTTACEGGVKCPFGNTWNCTGPNNTTEINNLKTEISNIKTDITNIKTNITNLTNRITNIENNSGSGSGTGGYSQACSNCNVGQIYDSGYCFDISNLALSGSGGYYVYAKEDGKCKAFAVRQTDYTTKGAVSQEQKELSQKLEEICRSNNIFSRYFQLDVYIYMGDIVVQFQDGSSGIYGAYNLFEGCTSKGRTHEPALWPSKAEYDEYYNSQPVEVLKGISF